MVAPGGLLVLRALAWLCPEVLDVGGLVLENYLSRTLIVSLDTDPHRNLNPETLRP